MAEVLQVANKPVIRRSLAEALLTCRDFEREDGEQLAFGQAAHSFFATYLHQCQATGEETRLTDVATLATAAWERTEGLDQNRWPEYMQLCQQFSETHTAELSTLTAYEHTEVVDVGFAFITGTMDRIDRLDHGDRDDAATVERILDYKTEQGEMDHAFQLSTYAQLRFLNHPALRELHMVIDPVRDRYRAEPLVLRRGDVDFWWASMLRGLRQRLEAPLGRPVGGPACPMCAKRYACPKSLAIARAVPENLDQAEEIFEETLRLEESVKVHKEGLKVFFQDRAPHVAHAHEIGFLAPRDEHMVITAAPAKLRTWLKRRHVDADAAFKYDLEVLRPFKADLIEAGLATLERSRPSFKWRNYLPSKKAKQGEKENADEGTRREGDAGPGARGQARGIHAQEGLDR